MSVGVSGGNNKAYTPVMEKQEESKIDRIKRYYIPREKYCPNCVNSIITRTPNLNDNFCPNCGKELEERIGEVYITIDYKPPEEYDFPTQLKTSEEIKNPEPPKKSTARTITLRELVVILKQYEKEVVLENL